jgi:hypothetical protein
MYTGWFKQYQNFRTDDRWQHWIPWDTLPDAVCKLRWRKQHGCTSFILHQRGSWSDWSVSHPGRFTPIPFGLETVWTSVPVWTTWRRENSCPHRDSNSDPSIVQSVASRYTDCAIPAPKENGAWLFAFSANGWWHQKACGPWPCRSSAVRRWVPTAAARVRVRAACGICGRQSGTGVGFLRVLRFPLPIIPPIAPLSKSPWADTINH